MDFYIRFRQIIILIIILSLTLSCRTTKESVISDKKFERQEIITKQYPYKIEISEKLKYTSSGKIKPTVVNLNYNEVKGTVTINDNLVTYLLESKDTIVTSEVIKEKTDVSLDVKVEPVVKEPTTLWEKFKKFGRKVFLWSILLNIIFIGSKIYSLTRRVYMPM